MDRSINKSRMANSLMFLVCGFGVSSWAPLIPLAKARLNLDNGNLGLLLLTFGCGAMITMPLTGYLIHHLKSKNVIFICGVLLAGVLPLLLITNHILPLGIALFVFGIAAGGINVAMNTQAIQVQNLAGKHIMSSFHGLYSVGGLLGSIGFGVLLTAGFSAYVAIGAISVLLLIILTSQYRNLLNDPVEGLPQSFKFLVPRGPILVIGLICFASALIEGAMLDWSGVFLRFNRNIPSAFTGLGFAMFSVAMAFMRLKGDQFVNRAGTVKVLTLGSIVAVSGLLLVICINILWVNCIGFIMVGVGCANMIPMLFSAASKVSGIAINATLATVTSMTYAGVLAGPAIIGLIAKMTTLPIALAITSGCLLTIVVVGRNKIYERQI